ncbi:unnamed protein product [Closterium sp. NIES-54]
MPAMDDEACDDAGTSLLSHESEPEWAQVAGMASDLVVTVGQRAFHAHQYPLCSQLFLLSPPLPPPFPLVSFSLSTQHWTRGGQRAHTSESLVPPWRRALLRPHRLPLPRPPLPPLAPLRAARALRSITGRDERVCAQPSPALLLPQLPSQRRHHFLQHCPHCLHVLISS